MRIGGFGRGGGKKERDERYSRRKKGWFLRVFKKGLREGGRRGRKRNRRWKMWFWGGNGCGCGEYISLNFPFSHLSKKKHYFSLVLFFFFFLFLLFFNLSRSRSRFTKDTVFSSQVPTSLFLSCILHILKPPLRFFLGGRGIFFVVGGGL